MSRSILGGLAIVATCLAAGLWPGSHPDQARWQQITAFLWRSCQPPYAYALVDEGRALLIDPGDPALVESLKDTDAQRIDLVLLTHHHRLVAAGAVRAAEDGVPVYAPADERELLTPEGVRSYWENYVPVPHSRVAHFVLGSGIPGVRAEVDDQWAIEWRGYRIRAVATPGHSWGAVTYVVTTRSGSRLAFVGGMLAAKGKVWAPFTLEWDHWTDRGFAAAAESLARLRRLKPDLLLPTFGEPIREDVEGALRETAEAVRRVGFLKSFERFSKQELGNPPSYAFLAPEQVATAGQRPFTRLSEHLFVTGNTYLLVSRSGATMAIDLWGQRSVDRIRELVAEHGWNLPEVVLISHAHSDHYNGIFQMPNREAFEVWTLEKVAEPLTNPGRYRHPFLERRPVRVDRVLKDGEVVRWREYTLKAFHFPGQTEFTMGVEAWIDGKHCVFTADNFFHMDQFSGSGGWTGLNRAFPDGYEASAAKLLQLGPRWVLAEHGGPFEFDREDFRRRVAWARAARAAMDALSPTGSRYLDWDPHRVALEPILVSTSGATSVRLRVTMRSPLQGRIRLQKDPSAAPGLAFRPIAPDGVVVEVRHDAEGRGRRALPVRVYEGGVIQPIDAFVVLQ